MHFVKTKIFFSLLIMGGILSCSTAPDFDRNNIKDPGSDNFVPTLPEGSEVAFSISPSKDLYFIWNDSEYLDGAIIHKSYKTGQPFGILDTLYTTTFIDSSKAFTQGTSYKIDFFRMLQDSSFVFSKKTENIKLHFDPFEFLDLDRTKPIRIRGSYNLNDSENPPIYYDGVEIQVIESSHDDSLNWKTISITEPDFSNPDEFYVTLDELDVFDLRLKMKQFINDTTGEPIILKENTIRQHINSVEDVFFYFQNEFKINVNWENIGHYYDGFIIRSNQTDTVLPSRLISSTVINLDKAPESPISVSVQPFVGNNYGAIKKSSSRFPRVSQPYFIGFKNKNGPTISWRGSSDIYSGFIIEQKANTDTDFTPIDTVSADIFSYSLTNLDPAKNYTFKVHSYVSEWSPPLNLVYQPTFVLKNEHELEYYGRNYYESNNNRYVAKVIPTEYSSFSYDVIYIKDIISDSKHFIELPSNSNDWKATFKGFVISEETQNLIFIWDRDTVDSYGDHISIYNLQNKEFILHNRIMPSQGVDDVALTNDENLIIIKDGYKFELYDIDNNSNIWSLDTQGFVNGWMISADRDYLVVCTDSGLNKYNVNNGALVESISESCINGKNLNSNEDFIYLSNNQVKSVDLTNFISTTIIENATSVLDTQYLEDIYYYWYFEEDDLFIYRSRSTGRNYRAFSPSNNQDFGFVMESLDEDRPYNIEHLKRLSSQSYEIRTLNGIFTYDIEENWSL